eukprot:CAMPEP_0185593496 /NCGR_PEP_ID=MMETSP0434-20130131/71690_1 /TAXON_ID=626734 ORGANISM="Favella taraikaensis, Strain Fe Narragansett Bay" /NCGR_SAMPLE_ID=MMETSP0434 /ASSEMBLY_ACC=CAM_ASM_000379 /LENGTH=87 /DNA_ID=CAMNT_0028220117 /DNA_START=873 /DNA_END=1133 /DNA_ORIENTATION=-
MIGSLAKSMELIEDLRGESGGRFALSSRETLQVCASVDLLAEESLLEVGYCLSRATRAGKFARLHNSLLVLCVLLTLLMHQNRRLVV